MKQIYVCIMEVDNSKVGGDRQRILLMSNDEQVRKDTARAIAKRLGLTSGWERAVFTDDGSDSNTGR